MHRLRLLWWLMPAALLLAGYLTLRGFGVLGAATQLAMPVPPGDQEIAWIQPATSGSTWQRLLAGIERVRKDWPALRVDERNAFPEQTTAVPEIGLSLQGVPGTLWIRWYKMSSEAGIVKWTQELARRN